MTIHGSHDPVLVTLSIVVAMTASYTALDLASRTKATSTWSRRGWLAAAACAMGGGIWAMHFVAMLAFVVPDMEIGYDPLQTVLSIVLAVLATGIAFIVVAKFGTSWQAVGAAGTLMGVGIAAMHYMGMAAMRMPAIIVYSPVWVLISKALAIGASIVALKLAFRDGTARHRVGGALVMGVAIAGMHFAAMRGATFSTHGETMRQTGALGSDGLGLAVAATTFLLLVLALLASLFDRRLAEVAEREARALRKSQDAFRDLYRRTPLPLHALDASGSIEEASDAWLDLLGYTRAEVVGRPFADFLSDDPDSERPDIVQAVRSGEVRDLMCHPVSRSGARLDVLISAHAEYDEDGTFRRAICGLIDITARRRAEEALRQSQKMEAIGQVTGGVAHDFNNLLAVVLGNLDRLGRLGENNPDARTMLAHAQSAAQRGVNLTQRMLAFARKQELDPEPVDLNALINGMRDLLQQSLGPEVFFEIDVPQDLPLVQADSNQTELALLNLAVNGRDAMPEGGLIAVSARCEEVPPGETGDLAPGTYVCLSVRDSGTGMSAETLARARDPFYTTKPIGKGTGLGLSMVDGFARQSGGTLRLASRTGEGVTAEIWLPVAPEQTRAALRPRPEGTASRSGPMTVLAVDDDALVLMNTVALLEELGHTVLEANSGAEAIALVHSGRSVDLVISDQGMPNMTGLQLAAELRALRPDLPVVIATGYADLPDNEGHVRLSKPFDLNRLSAAIASALAREAALEAG